MTLISMICLLALASSAFGRSSYGSYSFEEPKARTLLPAPVTSGYSSGYGSSVDEKSFLNFRTLPAPSEAEIQCRGKQPGTIILVDNGRKWITCLEEGAATLQSCASSLYFNLESGRCERRPGQLENPCLSSPCLNNGQCVAIDSNSFECRCGAGFDGTFCELDARVCQTQQPCGSSPSSRCQSFRAGAALQYVCIHNNGQGYGFSAQQVIPNICVNMDGTHSLSITDKGFLMCDGERMFIESCPGGTIWDNINKACVWPDMQDFTGNTRSFESSGNYGYSEQKVLPKTFQSYGETTVAPRTLETVAYGETTFAPRTLEQVAYGETTPMPRTLEPVAYGETVTIRPRFNEHVSSYGQSLPKARTFEPVASYGHSMSRTLPKVDIRVNLPKSGY